MTGPGGEEGTVVSRLISMKYSRSGGTKPFTAPVNVQPKAKLTATGWPWAPRLASGCKKASQTFAPKRTMTFLESTRGMSSLRSRSWLGHSLQRKVKVNFSTAISLLLGLPVEPTLKVTFWKGLASWAEFTVPR